MKKAVLFVAAAAALIAGLYCWNGANTPSSGSVVVVYVSEDQVFSEPILKDFEEETGIKVLAVYDTEEAKSTGAMNRLIAEKANPQADVYWANEPIRAEILKQKGISAPYLSPNAKEIPPLFKDPDNLWTGFSARIRVLLVAADVQDPPQSIFAYTKPRWKGKAVLANPLFGTTTAEISALFTLWKEDQEKMQEFMAAMKRNDVAIATSNGESADFVAAGKYDFSLVDSDDAVHRMRQGKKVTIVYPDQEEEGIGVFVVPNAVVLIKGARHPKNAKRLIDYLLSKETERKLALADCAQIPLHPGLPAPPELKAIQDLRVMQIEYAEVAKTMVEIQPFLKNWLGQ